MSLREEVARRLFDASHAKVAIVRPHAAWSFDKLSADYMAEWLLMADEAIRFAEWARRMDWGGNQAGIELEPELTLPPEGWKPSWIVAG